MTWKTLGTSRPHSFCCCAMLYLNGFPSDSLLDYSKPFGTTTISWCFPSTYVHNRPLISSSRQQRLLNPIHVCRLPSTATGWWKSKAVQIHSRWFALASSDHNCSWGCWGKRLGISAQRWSYPKSLLQEPYGDYSFWINQISSFLVQPQPRAIISELRDLGGLNKGHGSGCSSSGHGMSLQLHNTARLGEAPGWRPALLPPLQFM